MSLVSIDPATGRVLQRYRPTPAAEVETTLARAARAPPGGGRSRWRPAARRCRRSAPPLRARREALAELITAEMGKPLAQSLAEVEKCAACCDYYARQGEAFLAPEIPPEAPAGAVVHFEPLGVILAIMPWNFPLWQAFRAAIPALVAGNGLVLKHASNVSGCALAIAAVVRAAGLPRDLLQVLLVSGRDASALIGDARIRGVTLTGSTEAGRAVAALAGAALNPRSWNWEAATRTSSSKTPTSMRPPNAARPPVW
jgi:succinate-semialdehyde dehydrogenase/glutarate-semialdehyde dehydrogenase